MPPDEESPSIAAVCEALSWKVALREYWVVHERFGQRVADAVAVLLSKIKRESAEELTQLLDDLGPTTVSRILFAPETTCRLFFRREEATSNAEFLRDAVSAEECLVRGSSRSKPLWTALGDFCAPPPEGNSGLCRALASGIPVDFESPYALKISLDEDSGVTIRSESGESRVSLFTTREKQIAIDQMNEAFEMLLDASETAAEAVTAFTKVIVLRKDDNEPDGFSSSSAGQYTGRSMFVNAQHRQVRRGILADAILHEAIHSLLYMAERHDPWILADDLYFDTDVRIRSPWSGRLLRLRPYLQACFVWFGLYRFWSSERAHIVFGATDSEWLASRARKGFLGRSLLDPTAVWNDGIAESVRAAIARLQSAICSESSDNGLSRSGARRAE